MAAILKSINCHISETVQINYCYEFLHGNAWYQKTTIKEGRAIAGTTARCGHLHRKLAPNPRATQWIETTLNQRQTWGSCWKKHSASVTVKNWCMTCKKLAELHFSQQWPASQQGLYAWNHRPTSHAILWYCHDNTVPRYVWLYNTWK